MIESMIEIEAPRPSERWKNLLVFLVITNTVIIAVLAALQSDAGIRAALADRDSQYFAIAASGELHRAGLAADYEFRIVYDVLKNTQEGLILQMTALEQGMANATQAAGLNDAAAAAQARADTGRKFTSLFSDPRYAPRDKNGFPNFEAYLKDTNARAKEWTGRQNAAADEYQRWNQKSDDYLMILTITAVAFLLFGVGQTLRAVPLRLVFAIFGGYIEFVCVIWALVILFT